jgi:predicted secreted protein
MLHRYPFLPLLPFRRTLALGLALFLGATAARAQTYGFQPLDDPAAGGSGTFAYGFDGSNVVGFYTSTAGTLPPFNNAHGFLYNGTAYTTLDDPDANDTGNNHGTQATGISNGTIVGDYNTDFFAATQGFLYNNGTYTTLADPHASPSAVYSTVVLGIDGGNIVGFYSNTTGALGTLTNSYYRHGFLYNGGIYTTLDDPVAAYYTVPTGVSGGNIVGWYFDDSGHYDSFLYAIGAKTYTTLDEPNADGNLTEAQGIAGGNVVGYYQDGNGTNHGFVYNIAAKTYLTLDDPNAAGTGSASGTWATGISLGGNVVGYYTDSDGDVHSFLASIEQTAPLVTTQPVNKAAFAGNSTTFTAAVSGNPPPALQWQSSTDGGNTWGNLTNGTGVANATTTALTLSSLTTAMSGEQFRLFATNSQGNTTSNAATLTVTIAGAPAITTPPANTTVTAGNSTTFTVVATGNSPLAYQWQFNGGNISGATKASYTISSTTTANTGNYAVLISNSLGNITSAAALLTVDAEVGITTSPVSVTVNLGQPATFTVVATGFPTPMFQWQISTDSGATFTNITGNTSGNYSGYTSASLIVGNATSAQSGDQFRAIATNIFGGFMYILNSASAILTVHTPVAIANLTITSSNTTTTGNDTISAGQSVTFAVTPAGTPPFTYQWQFDGGNISGATNATYTIAKTASTSAGNYTVIVSNALGNVTSSPAVLAILSDPAPAIATQPANITVTAGQVATFTTAANGNPTPAFLWQISLDAGVSWANLTDGDGIAGSATAVLTVSDTTMAMSGQEFRAVATNSVSSATSDPATLTVTVQLYSFQTISPNPSDTTLFPAGISGGNLVGWDAANHGFVYNLGTQTTTALDDPNAVQNTSGAKGISGNNLVGYYYDGDGIEHGFVYNLGTQTYSTLDNPAGVGGYANGISGGNVIGLYVKGNATFAYLYNLTAQVFANLTLDALPSGISGGNFVGSYTDTNGNHGYYYNGTAYTTLDAPNASGANGGTTANGVSGGNVVGSYVDVNGDTHGFCFNVTTGNYTTIDDPLAVGGTIATAIDGGNIVGYYTDANGDNQIFLATLIFGGGNPTAAPAISTQPVSVGVLVGQSATFTVSVTGNPAPGFQWQFNGKAITGATAASYTIPSVAKTNFGNYTVVVSNGVGSPVTSATATLTLGVVPKISTSPASSTVNAGQSATFKVAVTGNPLPTIQWQSAPAGSTTFSNITGGNFSGFTTTSLMVASTTAAQSGAQFRAIATSTIGNTIYILTSKFATLTVNSPAHVTSLSMASGNQTINSTTGNLTVSANSSVTFTVGATGNALKYQWLLNGVNIKGATKATYTIAKAVAASAGTYSVSVSNPLNLKPSAAGTFVLSVLTPPAIVTPLKATSAKAGTAPMLKVVVTGNPLPVFTWSFAGGGLPSNSNITTTTNLNTVTSVLNFSNVTVSNTGTYKVVVTNPLSPPVPLSSSAKLTVK